MHVKSIEIVGFKTFVDKVSLHFPSGITALVGPNGCGKSNIVDAFRWVLGEQSAKQLRGKIMEDVIFSGSDSKKPTGMAEVTLMLSNETGGAPPPYSEYSEIMVTRRLFRSGESEYYINKVPCRLKDITELFLDTGVGAHAYSIIEQGNVEQIINSKPLERRSIIDEVAGISKYKNRKKEALAKLETTQNNLLRVDDIIFEVKRQLNSIKRQTSKLKRYQELKEEVKKIELHSSLCHYASLKNHHEHLREQREQCKREELKLTTQMSAADATIEEAKLDLTEEEKLFTRTQEEIYTTSSLCQKEEAHAEYLTKDMVSLTHQHTQHLQHIETLTQRMEAHQREIELLEHTTSELTHTVQEIAAELATKELQLPAFKETSAHLDSQIDQEKGTLIDLLTALSHLNNHLSQLEKTHHSLTLKREHTTKEIGDYLTRRTQLEQELSLLHQELHKVDDSKRHHAAQKVTFENTIDLVAEELQGCERNLVEVNEQCERVSSRLSSLEELQKKYEGCDSGVRTIMLRDHQATERNGVCGLVADFIETEPQYETALEAILGEKLHYVVVKSQVAGVEALEYLKTQAAGRVSFIPLHLRNHQADAVSLSPEKGEAYPLIQLVKTKEEYQPIVEYLLSDVLLVDTISTALAIWNNNGIRCTLVTLEGDIIDPAGIITGGVHHGINSNTLSMRREIKELGAQLSQLTPQREQLYHHRHQLMGKRTSLAQEYETLKAQIHQEEMSLLSLTRDRDQLHKELDDTRQRRELLEGEVQELASAIREVAAEVTQLQQQKESTIAGKNEKESSLAHYQENARHLHRQIDTLQSEMTALMVQSAAEKEKSESALATLQRMKHNCSLLSEEHTHALHRSKEYEQTHHQLENELQQTTTQRAHYRQILHELEQSLHKKKDALVEKGQKVKEREEALKQLRHSLDEVKATSNELTLQLSEYQLTITHLLKEISDKYHLGLEDLLQTTPPEALSEDRDTSYQRLDELKRKIEGLGEINLAADQEEEELMQRYQFLTEQREDLTKSLESLNLAINKINRTTKQQFLDTFHTINEKFKMVFPELFQGGRAELRLTDESNIFETGIDIVVQPPGKRLQIIDLLSGGEKALTAFALLMAIFLVKPSPFYLLDEADSALDDTNAVRFNHYLKNISHNSQFALITHNKLTMQSAHTLYGITMEEPGVSKIVSVQLQ